MARVFYVRAALLKIACRPFGDLKDERPNQKNECAISVIPTEQWKGSLGKPQLP
jgi:hypothetical protein